MSFDDYLDDLGRLVAAGSVYAEGEDDYPFGQNVQLALDEMINIAARLGFKTFKDPNGYYGYAEAGQGELFGVIGHLDVVPVGNIEAWDTEPFKMTNIGGTLHGRGVIDDKGPILASLYALKSLLDDGFHLSKRVRFIFGLDEESLWRGINRYKEEQEHPVMGFSPDAVFPLIFAEKGLLQAKLVGTQTRTDNMPWSGGGAFNAVPGKIIYSGENQATLVKNLQRLNFHHKKLADGVAILGRSIHAMLADQGVNAIARAFIALEGIYENNATRFVTNEIGEDAHAQKIFGQVEDDVSGKLTLNLGMFEFTESQLELSLDIRIPVTVDKEVIVTKLREHAKQYDLQYEEFDWLAPLYVEKDSELVKKLMEAYQEVTGDTGSQPLSSGGATYARAMENSVAFGALLPKLENTEHQENERVHVDVLKTAIKVYKKAFEKLV